MFDSLLPLLQERAADSPWMVFLIIGASGLLLPISEDLVLLGCGWIAANLAPMEAWWLFFAGVCGAYASDWATYGIGRGLMKGAAQIASRRYEKGLRRAARMQLFFDRYGIWALILGRLVPFGFRTGLFLAAGIGRVPCWRFAWVDALACLLTNTLLFGLAYFGHQHAEAILQSVRHMHWVLLAGALIAIGAALWRMRLSKRAQFEQD